MEKSHEEIAADILIAAMQKESWAAHGGTHKAKATSIGEAYEIILRSVRKASESD